MNFLPTEILEEILALVLLADDYPSPLSILLTCSTFHDLGSKQLYNHLRFRTSRQLCSFLAYYTGANVAANPASPSNPNQIHSKTVSIRYPPRTMEFCLSNDPTTRIFYQMHELFVLYQRLGAELDGSGRIDLDSLWWGFNSHMRDPESETIRRVLALVNPRKFSWTGPDPLHHFSIAIVPPAVPYLFHGLSGFTNLRELTLTHIALINTEIIRTPFPILPELEKIYIGQATFVDPGTIARAVLSTADLPNSKLREVRLVDVYKESIWGPRLRRSDLEEAAASIAIADATSSPTSGLDLTDPSSTAKGDAESNRAGHNEELSKYKIDSAKRTIRTVVVCQAKAERRYGGDRAQALQSPFDSL